MLVTSGLSVNRGSLFASATESTWSVVRMAGAQKARLRGVSCAGSPQKALNRCHSASTNDIKAIVLPVNSVASATSSSKATSLVVSRTS